jgi:hypothetical protein
MKKIDLDTVFNIVVIAIPTVFVLWIMAMATYIILRG